MSYGLDKHIDTTIQRLEESLWLPYETSFKGRSWVIDKKNGNQPFAYLGNNEYKEVLATDLKDALIHFHVESNRPNSGYSTYTANVYIMVAVNLGKIYGSDSRAVERAHKEVTDVINNSPFGRCDLVTDIEAYNIYDLSEKQTKLFNMQPYYVFRLESEITYNANQTCPIEEDQTYDVTTSIVGDGAINSNPETLTGIERNTLVSLNATANTGSRFVNWVYKGLTSVNRIINFYVTENISAIATFIAQWNLTTSVEGNGTISPGDGVYDNNTVVDITVTPDEGYEIDRVESNSVEIFEPYQVTMTEDKNVIAYIVAIFTTILDVFSQLPIYINDGWYYEDLTEEDNNLKCVNTQGVYLGGANDDSYADTGIYIEGGTAIDWTNYVVLNRTERGTIFGCGGSSGTHKGISVYKPADTNLHFIYISDGVTSQSISAGVIIEGMNKIRVQWSGVAGDDLTYTLNGVTSIYATTKDWVGNSRYTLRLSAAWPIANYILRAEHYYFNAVGICEYKMQEGNGLELIDLSTTGNDASIVGTITESELWNVFTDELEPYKLTNNLTVFKQIADTSQFIYALYDNDNNPTRSTITGYTNEGELLVGGFTNIGNELIVPVNSDLNEYIDSGQQDWQYFSDLVESENIIKEETETTITSLIVKKKSNSIANYNENTTYDEQTNYTE